MAMSEPHSAPAALDFNALYREQWRPLLRMATGLLDEADAAEDVVQDAFAALYRRAGSLRDPAAAIGYLRACVVNGTRAVTRRKILARNRMRPGDASNEAAADESVLLTAEHDLVRAALDKLPDRQREVLTLRFVAELPDDEIAVATGLSEGGVRSASSRGLAALRTVLGGQL
jgi:RNA polymerase sigma factor (sigma-70 family)